MLRLITGPLGGKDQGYDWEKTEGAGEVAITVEGLNADWRLILVRYFHGSKDNVCEQPIVVAVAGPYRGVHLAWMDVSSDEDLCMDERVFPALIGEQSGPYGQCALALVRCVEGCNNLAFCKHPDEHMMETAETVQRQLFEALAATS